MRLFQIVGGLVKSLNNLYDLFMRHNVNFNGSISLFAHSLGSVMAYDILNQWSPLLLYDQYVTRAIVRG